jgi:hypothetical protein
MQPIYWLTRQQEEAVLAEGAASTEARLVHHELATRYGDKASQADAVTLACLGVEGALADQYWVNGFRYPSTGDVIAEVRHGGDQ